jgi:tripartite-type tricarboxylate transporter receptor subunit TctC
MGTHRIDRPTDITMNFLASSKHSRRTATRLLAVAALCAASGAHAQQAAVPKTVRLIVAYPAGGVSDVVARALGDRLAAQMGTTVIVDNRAGASGAIGMDAVAKAAPDGATLGFSAISPLVLSPHLGKLPFDPLKDVAPWPA